MYCYRFIDIDLLYKFINLFNHLWTIYKSFMALNLPLIMVFFNI